VLWGDPDTNIKDPGRYKTSGLTKRDWELIISNPGINSLRLYTTKPESVNLTADVFALAYPKETPVLDVIELVPKITAWLDTTKLSIDNWASKEQIREDYAFLNIKEPWVLKKAIPLDSINRILRENKELHIIGFDILQIPRYRIAYVYSPGR
jgi:hypothetical protein